MIQTTPKRAERHQQGDRGAIGNSYAPLGVKYFDFDFDVHFTHKGWDGYVRCVRGEAAPRPSLTDNRNGTVTDSHTGLTWQQGEPGGMSWGMALDFCEGLELGDAIDWRLPNVKELLSLTDQTRFHPAVDPTFFPGVQTSEYWSSTTDAYNPELAWPVDFDNGSINRSHKRPHHAVRCVRGGH